MPPFDEDWLPEHEEEEGSYSENYDHEWLDNFTDKEWPEH